MLFLEYLSASTHYIRQTLPTIKETEFQVFLEFEILLVAAPKNTIFFVIFSMVLF